MAMAATVRRPGFESSSCHFSLFSFFLEQVGFQLNFRLLLSISSTLQELRNIIILVPNALD